MIFDSLARAERQHAADLARVESLRREEQQIAATRPDGSDFDALVAHDESLGAVRRKLTIAEGVAEHSAGLLEQARAEAEERTLAAEHAAEEKRAAADVKLIRDADALAAKLAEKLAEIEASRTRTEAVNAKRGNRRGIIDAETRVRQRMGQGRPAITETRELWVDEAGEVVAEFTTDYEGRQIKNPRAKRREPRTFTIHAEIPPMPLPLERLAECTRLIGIAGQLWPPR